MIELLNSPWICFGIFIFAFHAFNNSIDAFNNYVNKKYGDKDE